MDMPLSAQPWVSIDFVQKFAGRLGLSSEEWPLIEEILSAARPVRRRQDIVTEGRPTRGVFIVVDGLLIRYRIMRNGQRQVINVVVPGDVAGFPSCFFDSALYSIRTLTNSIVAALPVDTLSAVLDAHPRFAAKLLWLFSSDAALCAEHVVVVGRRTARERIAHFFLELLIRLRAVGLADATSFNMPFSQDIICDALGLSLPYVNRELRALTSDGLVTLDDHKVIINDVKAFAELADFEQRYLEPLPADEIFAATAQRWEKSSGANRIAAPPRAAGSLGGAERLVEQRPYMLRA